MTYVYDPRDYSAPNILFFPIRDEDPPAPDEDDWQGPEDDDEPTFPANSLQVGDEIEMTFTGELTGPRRVTVQEMDRECRHRFPSKRCRFCAEGDDG